jgi:hypothetical protein
MGLHSSAPGSRSVRRSFAIGGQEKEGFSASYWEAGDKHLLGEFARAGEVKLALEKEAHVGRLM